VAGKIREKCRQVGSGLGGHGVFRSLVEFDGVEAALGEVLGQGVRDLRALRGRDSKVRSLVGSTVPRSSAVLGHLTFV